MCSQVWDQITPAPPQAQVVKRVACLICDQVEAAFLMRILLLYRHVLFFGFFLHVTEKLINSSNLCMCVYSEVPRRVRKIPQLVIAMTFQKCVK